MQTRSSDRTDKIGFQLDGGKAVLIVERSTKGESHSGIGQQRQYTSMHKTHRIVHPFVHFQKDFRLTAAGGLNLQADQATDRCPGKWIVVHRKCGAFFQTNSTCCGRQTAGDCRIIKIAAEFFIAWRRWLRGFSTPGFDAALIAKLQA